MDAVAFYRNVTPRVDGPALCADLAAGRQGERALRSLDERDRILGLHGLPPETGHQEARVQPQRLAAQGDRKPHVEKAHGVRLELVFSPEGIVENDADLPRHSEANIVDVEAAHPVVAGRLEAKTGAQEAIDLQVGQFLPHRPWGQGAQQDRESNRAKQVGANRM